MSEKTREEREEEEEEKKKKEIKYKIYLAFAGNYGVCKKEKGKVTDEILSSRGSRREMNESVCSSLLGASSACH